MGTSPDVFANVDIIALTGNRDFADRELLTRDQADSMLAWPNSGFHVHHAVRLEADDAFGILQLARYAARAPVSLQRMHYDAKNQRVRVVSDKTDGPTAGTHEFHALEFLARLPLCCPR